jgi:transcriptional regulator with XRE-family HTH domain
VERSLHTFGRNVRTARHQKEWSQEDLAHRSGLSPVQISRIERGVREVRLTTVLKLVAALELSPNDLFADLY